MAEMTFGESYLLILFVAFFEHLLKVRDIVAEATGQKSESEQLTELLQQPVVTFSFFDHFIIVIRLDLEK